MTTTRYAIELEPGQYADGNAIVKYDNAKMYAKNVVEDVLYTWLDQFPHARIVKVKCEVQDEA